MFASIIILTCNNPNALKRAIESVVRQRFESCEIVIVDDNSEEDNQKQNKIIVQQYKQQSFKHIQYFCMNEYKGKNFCRNYGVLNAKGKWIIYLDDNNELYGEMLTNLNKYCTKYPLINMITAQYVQVIDNQTDICGKSLCSSSNGEYTINHNEFNACSFCHTKDLFLHNGGWNVTFLHMSIDEIILRYLQSAYTYYMFVNCIFSVCYDNKTLTYPNFYYLNGLRDKYYNMYRENGIGEGELLIVTNTQERYKKIINNEFDTKYFLYTHLTSNFDCNDVYYFKSDINNLNKYIHGYYRYCGVIFFNDDDVSILNCLIKNFCVNRCSFDYQNSMCISLKHLNRLTIEKIYKNKWKWA